MREVCILDVDSPSYPPATEEYIQCGCKLCREFLSKKGYYLDNNGKLIEPRTAAGSLG